MRSIGGVYMRNEVYGGIVIRIITRAPSKSNIPAPSSVLWGQQNKY